MRDPYRHYHICTRCHKRWKCLDVDCTAPTGYECVKCFSQQPPSQKRGTMILCPKCGSDDFELREKQRTRDWWFCWHCSRGSFIRRKRTPNKRIVKPRTRYVLQDDPKTFCALCQGQAALLCRKDGDPKRWPAFYVCFACQAVWEVGKGPGSKPKKTQRF